MRKKLILENPQSLIPKRMQRRGYPPAAANKNVALRGVYRHHRGSSQQAAEFGPVAGFFSGDGDNPHSGGFVVDHADGHFVGDDGGEGGGGGVAGKGYHVETDGADRGHRFEFVQAERAFFDGGNHALIFGDGDEGAGKAADMSRCHNAALLHHVG